MEYELKIFNAGSREYEKALILRYNLLRKPLGLRFTEAELHKDKEDTHLALFEGDKVLACLTLSRFPNGRMKMRQVAVDAKLQRSGLGRRLSAEAEKYALEQGFTVMFCNARDVAAPFYTKLGYKVVSDVFTEVGIPHYTMEKELK
ncbi:MAG: GNAT family N-acetyltransferase [Chitinophagales bacterium]